MSMGDIVVWEMEPHEEKSVKALFQRVYEDTFSATAPVFDSAVQGERIYVALYKRQLAGIAAVWEPDAFIHYLFVDREFRHKGVGRAITESLAQTYQRPLTLKCLTENTEAMAFYRKTGWQEAETGRSEEGPYALLRYAPSAALPQITVVQ